MKILCCGFFPALQRTIEYKSFRPGEVNRALKVSVAASGKATNTARVLSILGADSVMLSFAGGANGETVQKLLETEDFECNWVDTGAETRICQTLLSDEDASCTELVEENPPPSSRDWKTFIQTFGRIQADFDRIVFCGNLPPHVPQEIYAELMACTNGDKVLVDSSKTPLLATLSHRPSVVKLNTEELAMTVKDTYDPLEQARELIAHGAGAVGITQGKDSAMLVTPKNVYRYSIPQIKAFNPIGSGDSVSAGISFALAKGSALPEAFAFGLACGTSNAMNVEPGVVKPEQIAELIPKIQIS